jgi:DNA processing protein
VKEWNEPDALTAFASLRGLGPTCLRAFREHYGAFSAAAARPIEELAQLASAASAGAGSAFEGLEDLRTHLHDVRREARRCGADLITAAHVAWPTRLALLDAEDPESEAPHLLYVRGSLGPLESRYSVAVVGSRAADGLARAQAKALATGLAEAGVSVVSGGALGVDGAAHRAALDAGGHTVVVQASGIDVPHPERNKKMFKDVVAAGGAVVTEMPPGTLPDGGLFPKRNRIISGLADLVVVVSGEVRSGTLSTARHAVNQERTVCAVPGDPRRVLSGGPNRLLVHGAAAVVDAADVVDLLVEIRGRDLDDGRAARWLKRQRETGQGGAVAMGAQVALTHGAHKLLERLEGLPRAPDSLADGTGLSGAEVAAALAELEMAGLAEKVAGGYVLAPGTGPTPRRERA